MTRAAGTVYAIEFSNGLVKVGMTRDFDKTRAALTAEAMRWGHTATARWNLQVADARATLWAWLAKIHGANLRNPPTWIHDRRTINDLVRLVGTSTT